MSSGAELAASRSSPAPRRARTYARRSSRSSSSSATRAALEQHVPVRAGDLVVAVVDRRGACRRCAAAPRRRTCGTPRLRGPRRRPRTSWSCHVRRTCTCRCARARSWNTTPSSLCRLWAPSRMPRRLRSAIVWSSRRCSGITLPPGRIIRTRRAASGHSQTMLSVGAYRAASASSARRGRGPRGRSRCRRRRARPAAACRRGR